MPRCVLAEKQDSEKDQDPADDAEQERCEARHDLDREEPDPDEGSEADAPER